MCVNRKTVVEERIERICRLNRFSVFIVMRKAKRILEQYRDSQVNSGNIISNEELVIHRFKKAVRKKYEQTYVYKQGEKTGSIDYMLMEIMGTEWAGQIMENVFEKMRDFDKCGADLVTIVDNYYTSDSPMDDVDIQVELDMTRSYYYRMKKAATALFGILLWNTVIDKCIND